MIVSLNIARDGSTIIATPFPKKAKFPPIKRVWIDEKTRFAYAEPMGLFEEPIALGTIPKEYKLADFSESEITFRSNKPQQVKKVKQYERITEEQREQLLLFRHRNNRKAPRL